MGPEIRRLADAFLQNPKEIAVSRPASVATTIIEGLALVAEHDKREALRRLIRTQNVQNALIFCNRKRDVDILHKSLTRHKFDVGALHGDMAQTVRFATLEKFKANELRLLVCSDVAARGLDIGGLVARVQLRRADPCRGLRPSHRPHRSRGAGGHMPSPSPTPEDRCAVEAIEKLIGHPIPPIDWSRASIRSTGRRTMDGARRGRGRSAGATEEGRASRSRATGRGEGRAAATERRGRREKPRTDAGSRGNCPRRENADPPRARPRRAEPAP